MTSSNSSLDPFESASSKTSTGGGGAGPEFFKMVDISGEGEMVRLWKMAVTTKNYTELDDYIRIEIEPFLYNQGNAENVKKKI